MINAITLEKIWRDLDRIKSQLEGVIDERAYEGWAQETDYILDEIQVVIDSMNEEGEDK